MPLIASFMAAMKTFRVLALATALCLPIHAQNPQGGQSSPPVPGEKAQGCRAALTALWRDWNGTQEKWNTVADDQWNWWKQKKAEHPDLCYVADAKIADYVVVWSSRAGIYSFSESQSNPTNAVPKNRERAGQYASASVHRLSDGKPGAMLFSRETKDYQLKLKMAGWNEQPLDFVKETFRDAVRFMAAPGKTTKASEHVAAANLPQSKVLAEAYTDCGADHAEVSVLSGWTPPQSDTVVTRLGCGEKVSVLARGDAWAKIRTASSAEGYVALGLLSDTNPKERRPASVVSASTASPNPQRVPKQARWGFQGQQPLGEINLGLAQRSRILAAHPMVEGTEGNAIAQTVFSALLSTSVVPVRPNIPYEVTLIRDNDINASSTAGGKVYVHAGMLAVLGNERGLWALVLGHEIGHTVRQHQYKAYLRAFEQRRTLKELENILAQSDGNWKLAAAAAGLATTQALVNRKYSRDDEHEADRLGLMMMAEAGYHPDFALILDRRIPSYVGDRSKLAAFFATHPRWATREERTLKTYADALALFESRWPDAAKSPGGSPPPIATLNEVSASQDSAAKAATIHIRFDIRNAKGIPATVAVMFTKNKKSVPAALPEFQVKDGALGVVRSFAAESSKESKEVSIQVPTAAIGTKDRTLEATVAIMYGQEVIETAKPLKVSFPQP